MPKEPYRLYRCVPTTGTFRGEFFTCARPGRSREPLVKSVPDDWVDAWVKGLPCTEPIAILSLLGWKANGRSEFSFYSFRGSGEETERPDRPTFQQWLDARYGTGRYRVIEFPTTDTKVVSSELLSRVGRTILSLLHSGETVVLMDSGGFSRTGAVCRFIGFVRQERAPNVKR